MKIGAKKDGKGNIIITENSFEMLLGCLDNQKFVGESPQNGDSISVGKDEYYHTQDDIQQVIDEYNRECRKILHQKLLFEIIEDGYFLIKKYEYQDDLINWEFSEVLQVRELFELFNPEIYIERNVFTSESNLTIGDGKKNRPWKTEEIEMIKKLFNEK